MYMGQHNLMIHNIMECVLHKDLHQQSQRFDKALLRLLCNLLENLWHYYKNNKL